MQMEPSLAQRFNEQITLELSSSVAYLQMAAFFEEQSLTGMAAWMRLQSEEERSHALRFLDFVLDRGNAVEIGAVEQPPSGFSGPTSVFETALKQEQRVTAAITDLFRAAQEAGDVASYPLLQDFLTEQVEEEATVEAILDRLELAGSNGSAILDLDRELGARGPENA